MIHIFPNCLVMNFDVTRRQLIEKFTTTCKTFLPCCKFCINFTATRYIKNVQHDIKVKIQYFDFNFFKETEIKLNS